MAFLFKRFKPLVLMGLLFVIALLIEIAYLKHYNVSYMISPDGELYSNMAENLLQGKGLVNTIRDRDYVVGPVYPLLLMFTYLLYGLKSYWAVIRLQTVLQALTALVLYKTGEELFGKGYAWIPYGLMLIYPLFPFWGIYVLTETTYVFMFTLFLYLLLIYSKNQSQSGKRVRIALVMGLVIGIANLVRPLLLLVFPFLLVWMCWVRGWRLKAGVKDFALVLLMTVLVMCPWWIRNYVKYHQFIAVTNYGAYELYVGNNPYTITNQFYHFSIPSYDPEVKARVDSLPVLAQEKEYSRLAEVYILQHPWKFVVRTVEKEVNLFWKPVDAWEGKANNIFGWQLDQWFLMLGLIGAFLSLFELRKYGFLLFMTLYYSFVVSMITVVYIGRYRLPIMPAIVILVSLVFVTIIKGFVALAKELKKSREQRT